MDKKVDSSYPGQVLDHVDAFRLVEVLPGQRDSPLVVRLLTFKLGNEHRYEALSYAWGDVKQTESLQVATAEPGTEVSDNSTSTVLLEVTHNCASAIRRLRFISTSRMLWIDSICINQSCVNERNHQLRLMRRIYSEAVNVVVYLGESDESTCSDTVMDWLHDMHRPSDDTESKGGVPINGIKALLSRRWFTRVWVLQEVHVAQEVTVICGNKEVSWDAFEQFLHWHENRYTKWMLPFVVRSITALRSDEIVMRNYPERLLRTLRQTRTLGATDPRDKLYAILPLIEWQDQRREENSAALSPNTNDADFDIPKGDYSWSTLKTFTHLARILLDAIGREVLRSVETPTTVPGLPSWAPDWSAVGVRPFRGSIQPWWREEVELLPTCDNPTWRWSFSDYNTSEGVETTQLHIPAARMVGIISRIGGVADIYSDWLPLEQWGNICDPVHTTNYPSEPFDSDLNDWECKKLQEVTPFIKALFSRLIYPHYMKEAVEMVKEYNKELEDSVYTRTASIAAMDSVGHNDCVGPACTPLKDIFLRFAPSRRLQCEDMFYHCHERRFFVTDMGDLGLAPKMSEVGDSLMEIPGFRAPFVVKCIRASKTGSRVVRLVGLCSAELVQVGTNRSIEGSEAEYVQVIVR